MLATCFMICIIGLLGRWLRQRYILGRPFHPLHPLRKGSPAVPAPDGPVAPAIASKGSSFFYDAISGQRLHDVYEGKVLVDGKQLFETSITNGTRQWTFIRDVKKS